MKNKPTERQKSELARRRAMGVALIIRPLKFIAEKVNSVFRNERGELEKTEGWQFIVARRFADLGDGAEVQRFARTLI
jgi:hypothetical protein